MAVDIEKFPFKWMTSMVNYLDKRNNENFKSFNLSRAIGACIPDTNEVARMLNYLTHYGKVTRNEKNSYFLEFCNNKNPPEKNFRFNYIKNLDEIICIIKEESIEIETLAQMLGREVHDVEKDINFLELITSKGRVCLDGKRYNPSIYFMPWLQKDA
ncbi:MAG: hypothetical protein ACFFAU_08560 [Candidatus Hodarchaeota archaeon]